MGHPDPMNDLEAVKPSARPKPFSGVLQEETHNLLSEWHVRFFELKDGNLTWWITQEDQKNNAKPQCCLSLVGLMMKVATSSTRFAIRTVSSKGVVYNFDCNTGTGAKPLVQWVQALKQHSAF